MQPIWSLTTGTTLFAVLGCATRCARATRVVSHIGFSALLLAAALQACGDDAVAPSSPAGATTLDAGADSGLSTVDTAQPAQEIDAGAAVRAPLGSVCSGELPVMSVLNLETNSEEEPDWSCYADAKDNAAPPSARQVTFSLAMSVPALVGSIEGLTADVFFGPSTLGKPAASLKFGRGETALMLDVPASVTHLSANIHALSAPDPRFDTSEVHDYDLRIPDNGVVEGTTILRASYDLAVNLALAGGTADPSKASIGSEARDCLGRDVGGAVFELIDGETDQPVPIEATGTGPHVAYSQFALPNPNCSFTAVGRSD